jgi:hypothetical protein
MVLGAAVAASAAAAAATAALVSAVLQVRSHVKLSASHLKQLLL